MGQITCQKAKCDCLSSLDADNKKNTTAGELCSNGLPRKPVPKMHQSQPWNSIQSQSSTLAYRWHNLYSLDLVFWRRQAASIQSKCWDSHSKQPHCETNDYIFLKMFFFNRSFIALKLMESLLEPCLVVKLFTSWELHCSWLKLRGRG